jgi:hypothetical protein
MKEIDYKATVNKSLNEYIERKINYICIEELNKDVIECSLNIVLIVRDQSFSKFTNIRKNVHIFKDDQKAEKEFNKDFREGTHLLEYDHQKKITWRKSRFDSAVQLKKYIKSKKIQEIFSETDFINNQIEHKNPIIITGRPGEGKSTMLTSLSNILKKKRTESWIIRIDLKEKTKQFDKIQKFGDLKQSIEFLTKMLKSDLPLAEKLFKQALESDKYSKFVKIVLFFDGFDEICPDYEQVVISLFKNLKKTNAKMFITTRNNLKDKLEDELESLAYELVPFTEDEQSELLVEILTKNTTTYKIYS